MIYIKLDKFGIKTKPCLFENFPTNYISLKLQIHVLYKIQGGYKGEKK